MRNLLKTGLRRLASSRPSRHPMGSRNATIIAVAARKGGVGKTTTSVSLAAGLARYHDKRVLLIDLDPQGHVHTALKSAVHLGGGAMSDVLNDDKGELEVLDAATSTAVPGLHVTPFDASLAQTEDLLNTRIGKEYLLRDALRATRTHYDVIVIDCPPNLGNLAINGLVAAHQVLIPCDPSPLSLKGVESLVEAIQTVAMRLNPDIDVMGILLTRVDGRNTTVNEAVVGDIEQAYGDALLPVRIGVNTSLAKAQMEGRDIHEYAPDSRGAEQYKQLADWVAEQL